LHRDGSIQMSYDAMAIRDGIIGIYPQVPDTGSPVAVHFSSLSQSDGPFAGVYEAFHYLALPRPQDLACTVIQALGDRFDFLAYYSDFRMDPQEASPPSDGPIGRNVTQIGDTRHAQTERVLASRCTGTWAAARFSKTGSFLDSAAVASGLCGQSRSRV